MNPSIEHKLTHDGSSTLYAAKYDQHYHSIHGAVNESMHVFIEAGMKALSEHIKEVNILEMGFGTGLNALLTHVHQGDLKIHYTTIEAEPVQSDVTQGLNYPELVEHPGAPTFFSEIHLCAWNEWVSIRPEFRIYKYQGLLQDFNREDRYDLIFFDAFAPNAQPELWTPQIFEKLYAHSNPGAILTTYSAKGDVRRALLSAGYQVEKLPGPPGKREMLRAIKTS